MPQARTRPGLVREALLDGRVYWESTGLRGFLQQWSLSCRNTHPVCMICRSHRLSPLTACEHRSEGVFQLLSGFAGMKEVLCGLLAVRSIRGLVSESQIAPHTSHRLLSSHGDPRIPVRTRRFRARLRAV